MLSVSSTYKAVHAKITKLTFECFHMCETNSLDVQNGLDLPPARPAGLVYSDPHRLLFRRDLKRPERDEQQ